MPRHIARVPIEDIGIQRGDALRVLAHGVRNRALNQIVERLGVVHLFIQRARGGLACRNDRAVEPILVDRSIEIVLQVGAEQGIGTVDELVELFHGDVLIRRKGCGRGAGNNTGGEHVRQLLLRPGGDVGEVGRRITLAGVVALRGGQAAERALQHDERLGAGDGGVFPQVSVWVAVHHIRSGHAGVVVVRRGDERGADFTTGSGNLAVCRERRREARPAERRLPGRMQGFVLLS